MKLIDVAHNINIRRKSWPEEDYIQLLSGKCSYWNHTLFKWITNYTLKPEDILATDWEARKKK